MGDAFLDAVSDPANRLEGFVTERGSLVLCEWCGEPSGGPVFCQGCFDAEVPERLSDVRFAAVRGERERWRSRLLSIAETLGIIGDEDGADLIRRVCEGVNSGDR